MAELEPFSLKGKVILLTGATSGIGKRFAEVLHAHGATVVAVGRRADILQDLERDHPGLVGLPADLSDPYGATDIVDQVIERFGRVDVLVNNAAWMPGGIAAENETLEQMQQMLNINLLSPIRLAQAVFPGMKERGDGSIINVTSMVASVGIGRLPQGFYSATKGGLESSTREFAAQWSRFGVRMNAIAPGFIETGITEDIIEIPKIQDWIKKNTLIPRHGKPEDFDGAILYLASDLSSYVTGQTLTVDGGWTAH